MRYSAVALFLIGSLSSICAGSVQAQQSKPNMSDQDDAAIQQRAAAHMRSVRGAENPAAIPYGIKLRTFFREVDRHLVTDAGRDQLKAALKLAQGDWDVLTAAAQRERSALVAIEQASQKRMHAFCQRVSAGNLEPAAIGRSLTEAEDKNELALATHYKALVDRLTPDGQRALLSYIDNTVIRSMSYGRVDFEGLLAEFPELAGQVVSNCTNPAAPPPQDAVDPDSTFAPSSELP